MPEKELYFDESGFTGYNLLDTTAPIFVEASTDIGNEEAEHILRSAYPTYKGDEFHFSNFWRQRRKRPLTAFAREIGPYARRIKGFTIDKRFCVLTKALDFLVEPIYRAAGHDWYANGYCSRYVNFAFWGVCQEGSPELYDAIVTAWQRFSRAPSEATLQDIQVLFRIMANSLPEGPDLIAKQLAIGAELFTHFSELEAFEGSDELQVTTVTSIVAAWRRQHDQDFVVHHDASANLFRRKHLLMKIIGPDAPRDFQHLGDGTSVEFPLRVSDVRPLNSREHPAIQLCDMIAGIAGKLKAAPESDDDEQVLRDVVEAGFGELGFNGVYFRPEFPPAQPERQSGPDAVDKMMAAIFR